ncbi:MAG: 23S rRNA (pseudouridine(1915)-N(3))-methyltransferase RlmH [Alphaproteobacteria bacterium]
MRIHIAAVGKARAGPALDLYEFYARRLTWPLTLREVTEKRPLPAARLKREEATLLRAALPKQASVIVLDEGGRAFSSADFASRLDSWRDAGGGTVAFIIGGADGLADDLRAEADARLSLGPMTWPHLLVRAMLVEQLYRAQQIGAGHPYHRD